MSAVQPDIDFLSAALSWYDGTPAQADVKAAWERLRQALQLHGGGESRSDFASGSGGPTWDRVRALVSNARYSGISTIAEKNALLDSTTDQILALLNPTSPSDRP